MNRPGHILLAAIALTPFWAGVALAADDQAQITGSARATVVEPLQITPIEDLRFGQFFQPTANGQLRIKIDGSVIDFGGMAGLHNVTQIGTGRGPATFRVYAEPGRSFRVSLPNRIDITNGAATMQVRRFRDNIPGTGATGDATGVFDVVVGATLRVNALQATGTYSGTYDITVAYN